MAWVRGLGFCSAIKVLTVVVALGLSSNLRAQQAYISWVQSESTGESSIYVFIADKNLCLPWQPIYKSADYLATPVLNKSATGQLLAAWKTATKNFESSTIQYSVRQDGQWSAPLTAVRSNGELTSPAMITDSAGVMWLFWLSDENGSDDVYFSQYDNSKAKWVAPKLVNEPNAVPDIDPRLRLSQNGFVAVDWQQYDPSAGQYQSRTKVFSGKSRITKRTAITKEFTADDLIFPMQWRPSGSVNIHFPTNLSHQHLSLSHSEALAYSAARSWQ